MGILIESVYGIDKEAAVPWKTIGRMGMKGAFLGMGADYAGQVLRNVGDAASTTPVGEQSRQQWQAEVNRAYDERATSPAEVQARKNVSKGTSLGLGAGILAGVPIALKKKNPLLGLGIGLLGRTAGRAISRSKNPTAAPKSSMIDIAMNQYASLFTPEERAELLDVRNSPEVMKNPEKQRQIAEMIAERASTHPNATKVVKRGKTLSNVGKLLGGAGLLTMMLKGKGSKAGKGILGRLSGSVMPVYAGLAAADIGSRLVNTHVSGRRAELTPEERRRNLTEAISGEDVALSSMFYGSGIRPRGWK